MSLVDLQAFNGVCRVTMLELVRVRGRGVPKPAVVHRRHIKVLGHARSPGREPVDRLARGSRHGDLDHGVMRNSTDAWGFRRHIALPDAKLGLGHGVGSMRPVISKSAR